MSDCPRGECVNANLNFRKWKLGLEVFKLSVLSDTQNNSVDQACHDRLWSLSWLILSFIFWHIYDLSFHLNRWPVAIRQRRTVRSGQERCYLRCHSCSSYLAFIFLFSYQISSINLINQFNLCDYKVCTISKETKRKFNPVTKCEKVALETAMDFWKK